MDEWEKRIREKVWASKVLSNGEWVYLVGAFGALKDVDGLYEERSLMLAALHEIADLPDVRKDECGTIAKRALDARNQSNGPG